MRFEGNTSTGGTRSAIFGVITVALAVTVGCSAQGSNPASDPVDASEPVNSSEPVHEAVDYQLLTHCGIRWAQFEGQWWRTPFRGNRATHSAPAGWDDPFQVGTMRLITDDVAVFTSDGHPPLVFRATPKSPRRGCA